MLIYKHLVTKTVLFDAFTSFEYNSALFEINMTVKMSYNVGLIEYSFIDIALINHTNTSVPLC